MTANDLVLYILIFLGAGVAAGFTSGLFGIGGGVITVPIFIFLFPHLGSTSHVLMHMATGTSLALVLPASLSAAIRHHQLGALDLRYFRSWAISLFFGICLGLALLAFLSSTILEGIFIVILLTIAAYLFFGQERGQFKEGRPEGWIKLLGGFLVGTFSILVGTGGGVFTGPFMKLHNYPLRRAIALSSATGVVTATFGAIGAIVVGYGASGRPPYSLGYIDLLVFFAMLPMLMVFAFIGAKISHRIRPSLLRRLFGLFVLLMAIVMIIHFFQMAGGS